MITDKLKQRALEWVKIARLASLHGIRYPTNDALVAFLTEIDAPAPSEPVAAKALEREKLALLSALATAEDALFWAARQHHEYGNTRAQKATELAAHACRRALLGVSENAE